MTKSFSLGDFNVNQQAADGASSKKFNLGDFNTESSPNENEIKKLREDITKLKMRVSELVDELRRTNYELISLQGLRIECP